jgi:hypothetical protein
MQRLLGLLLRLTGTRQAAAQAVSGQLHGASFGLRPLCCSHGIGEAARGGILFGLA